ncbi:hypothetical protein KCP69_17185 [Salmonella enterica subsp. enterica]|nr:hypothetical protein KCP69_17185 [Salmonella enterica subsp. enterica]
MLTILAPWQLLSPFGPTVWIIESVVGDYARRRLVTVENGGRYSSTGSLPATRRQSALLDRVKSASCWPVTAVGRR